MTAKSNLLQFPKPKEYQLVCTDCDFRHCTRNFDLAYAAKRHHEDWFVHDLVILSEPITPGPFDREWEN